VAGGGGGDGNGSDGSPFTGSDTSFLAAWAGALVVLGTLLLVAARRRPQADR
jgi:LPXTG-motif cell wall-anchored protein